MKVTINYQSVGVRQFTGSRTHEIEKVDADVIAELAYRDIKVLKCCASKDIETQFDLDTNKGFVFAGWHTAGTFSTEAPNAKI